VDSLEKEAASEASPLGRDIAFAKAAVATDGEDYERGWRLAGKIQDKQFKSDVASWITYRATLHFIQKDNFAHRRAGSQLRLLNNGQWTMDNGQCFVPKLNAIGLNAELQTKTRIDNL
jgi:hypothetical protein